MVDIRVKEHFDKIAEGYYEEISPHIRDQLINKWWKLVSSYFRKDAYVLDIGCGEGTNVKFLRETGLNVMGIDASPRLIESGRARYPELKNVISEGDAHALDFEPNTFDIAYMIGVLHHMGSPCEQRRAIAEALRVVKENGYVIIRESNLKNPLFKIFWNYIFPLTAKIDKFGGEEWVSIKFFKREGFYVDQIMYFTFLPNFTPRCLLPVGGKIELFLERSPLKSFSAHHIAILKKRRREENK